MPLALSDPPPPKSPVSTLHSGRPVARDVAQVAHDDAQKDDVESEGEAQTLLRTAVAELVELHHISVDMADADSDHEMIRRAIAGAQEHLGIDRLAVFLRDGDMMHGTWGTDEHGNITDESDFALAVDAFPEAEMVRKALQEQHYVLVRNHVTLRNDDRAVGIGWNAMVALWMGDEALGWIACDNLLTQRPLRAFQIEVLKLFAANLAQALMRRRAEEELRLLNRELEERVVARTAELNSANEALALANAELKKISKSDGLTGIANRRLFDERLVEEWARCRRSGDSVALVMFDVDYFKRYNDSLGHQQGDVALRAVAHALKDNVWRTADLAARYGGEEFVLLLPQTAEDGALGIAERARQAVEGMKLEHPNSDVGPHLTVSAGIAIGDPKKDSAESTLQRADEALYAAKQQGRNRVVLRSDS